MDLAVQQERRGALNLHAVVAHLLLLFGVGHVVDDTSHEPHQKQAIHEAEADQQAQVGQPLGKHLDLFLVKRGCDYGHGAAFNFLCGYKIEGSWGRKVVVPSSTKARGNGSTLYVSGLSGKSSGRQTHRSVLLQADMLLGAETLNILMYHVTRPTLSRLGGWGTSLELWLTGSLNLAVRRHALDGWKSWSPFVVRRREYWGSYAVTLFRR